MTTRLSGLDATFLVSETDETPMHTLEVIVLERDRADRRAVEELVEAGVARAIEALPALRVRPVASTASRPRWEEVPVELARHVRIARMFARGEEAVDQAIAAHMEGTLPRDRPLWSLLVLEHVGSRRLTLALKHHHALTDGVGFARMLEVLAGRAAPIPYVGPARRGPYALAVELVALLFASVRGLLRSLAHPQPTPFAGPGWAFNARIGAGRRVARTTLSLARLREARDEVDPEATLNDVLLALVAGALRRTGRAGGERVARPLVAAQPAALKDVPHDRGNPLSTILAPLHVEVGDPRDRLRATRRSSTAAKAAHAARGPHLIARWSELLPGAIVRLFWAAVRSAPRPPAHVIVSNIPGASAAIALGAVRVRETYLVGPLLPTTGLNVTFYRYEDAVHVCVLAADGAEPRALADAIDEALEELLGERPRHSLAA